MAPLSVAGSPRTECRNMSDQTVRRIAAGCFGATRSGSMQASASIRWRYRLVIAGNP